MKFDSRKMLIVSVIFVVLFVIVAALGIQDAFISDAKTPPWGSIGIAAVALSALMWGSLLLKDVKSALPTSSDEKPLPAWKMFATKHSIGIRFAIIALLIAGMLYRLPQMTDQDHYGWELSAWLIAIVLYVQVFLPTNWRIPANLGFFCCRPTWMIIGLIAFALILRIYNVGSIPFTLAGDEASQGLESVAVIEGNITNPFATGWLGVPTLSFFYNAITIYLFGQTIFGLRLAWVLIGTATVVITFFLVRRVVGEKQIALAWAASILLAAYHFHIHFSRLGSNQVADPFFMSVSLFFIMRAYDDRRLADWALAGITTGLAMYFYAGARLTPVVMIAVLSYFFIRQPRTFFKDHGRGLLVLCGGFLIAGAPIIQYAIRFPNDFNARINQVGIIQSGWLEREIGIRGESMEIILWDQFQRAALPFHFYTDRTVWYGLETPWLDPFFGSIFLVGLGYATFRLLVPQSNPKLAVFVAWWWGGMILGGMMTESPPSSQRLITLSIPTIFFIALALSKFADLLNHIASILTKRRVITFGVVAFMMISLNTYFYDFTPKRIYGGERAEFATMISPRLNQLKYDHRFVFIGAPHMYWGFSTLPYLIPGADAEDFPEEPVNALLPADMISADRGLVFIVVSPRRDEIQWLGRSFPGGNLETYYSKGINGYLGSLYIVQPAIQP